MEEEPFSDLYLKPTPSKGCSPDLSSSSSDGDFSSADSLSLDDSLVDKASVLPVDGETALQQFLTRFPPRPRTQSDAAGTAQVVRTDASNSHPPSPDPKPQRKIGGSCTGASVSPILGRRHAEQTIVDAGSFETSRGMLGAPPQLVLDARRADAGRGEAAAWGNAHASIGARDLPDRAIQRAGPLAHGGGSETGHGYGEADGGEGERRRDGRREAVAAAATAAAVAAAAAASTARDDGMGAQHGMNQKGGGPVWASRQRGAGMSSVREVQGRRVEDGGTAHGVCARVERSALGGGVQEGGTAWASVRAVQEEDAAEGDAPLHGVGGRLGRAQGGKDGGGEGGLDSDSMREMQERMRLLRQALEEDPVLHLLQADALLQVRPAIFSCSTPFLFCAICFRTVHSIERS